MLKVLGHRVLVKVEKSELEKVTERSGIILTEDTTEKQKQYNSTGTVEGIGPTAFRDLGDGTPWCNIGDVVYFQRYGGIIVKEDGADYRILNDEDVLAIKN